jgi:hypothetical protein
MIAKRMRAAFVCLFALASTSALLPTESSASAAANPAPAPVLYRLDADSNEVQGCFDPCKCPIWLNDDLVGTMVLRFDYSAPNWFDYYQVADVNWVLGYGANAKRVTGRGTYRVGGPVALMQQMTLSLSIDGAAPVVFDSGLVAGGGAPNAIDVAVAMNNFFCFDRAFTISAEPVPAVEIVPYKLNAGATFTEGCQDPCLCPIWQTGLKGGFGLVDLGLASDPAFMHYALVDIGWRTQSTPSRGFKGLGIYGIDAVGVQHQLVCDIAEGSGKRQRFDSGLVPGGLAFAPQIDIDMALNGFFCWDQVFGVHAQP